MSEETVFAADGSPPPPAVRARLESFRFYRDVINKFGRKWSRRGDPSGLDDTVFRGDAEADEFIDSMDSWFRDASGGSVRFTGNEGNGEETEYSCYVLVVGNWEVGGAEGRSEGGSGDADDSESKGEGAGVAYPSKA